MGGMISTVYEAYRYATDGHEGEEVSGGISAGDILECGTIRECREMIAKTLGCNIDDLVCRAWPNDSALNDDVEAYHDYPETDPRALGCGGFAIREVSR